MQQIIGYGILAVVLSGIFTVTIGGPGGIWRGLAEWFIALVCTGVMIAGAVLAFP